MIKFKIRILGCFRSIDGARDYQKIMPYVGTEKKQKINAYQAVRPAISGTPDYFFAMRS